MYILKVLQQLQMKEDRTLIHCKMELNVQQVIKVYDT